MIGKWILGVAIATLVVQLMILGIAVFWSVEILQTANAISHWSQCLAVPTPAGCSSTPTPTPTNPWSQW